MKRAERRAAPSRPAIPSGDRPAYTPDEGQSGSGPSAGPPQAGPSFPSGDRPAYAPDQGQS